MRTFLMTLQSMFYRRKLKQLSRLSTFFPTNEPQLQFHAKTFPRACQCFRVQPKYGQNIDFNEMGRQERIRNVSSQLIEVTMCWCEKGVHVIIEMFSLISYLNVFLLCSSVNNFCHLNQDEVAPVNHFEFLDFYCHFIRFR